VTYKKKLIEVALPLEAINAACKADKDRKTGTIRNLHKWFAPMPSPAWRALLFAALVDAPSTEEERVELFQLIKELVASGGDSPPGGVLERARRLIAESTAGAAPPILDPFCGGGSTLVEAQRLGLRTFGSDLNPIPVLITRALVRNPPLVAGRQPAGPNAPTLDVGSGLDGFLGDVRHYAKAVRDFAEGELGALYPTVKGCGHPYAWIWARTVVCPNPACGATIPLISSIWLTRRKGEETWVTPSVDDGELRIRVESPPSEPPVGPKVGRGGAFRCIGCGQIASEAYVRAQGLAGRMDSVLMATAVEHAGRRIFIAADTNQAAAAVVAPLVDPPDVELTGKAAVNVPLYGISRQSDLYTGRQLRTLDAFCRGVAEVASWVAKDGGDEQYGAAIAEVLGLCIGKLAMANSTQVRWRIDSRNGAAKAEPAFGRHDLAMTWDFAETNPFGGSVGDWLQVVETALRAFDCVDSTGPQAEVRQVDARSASGVYPKGVLVATDPPYFDNINYADLSDYFYVWIRRALKTTCPELFSTLATPKSQELIAAPSRHNGDKRRAKQSFIDGFTEVFRGLVDIAHPDYPMLVVYAFKQQDVDSGGTISTGWEAMLQALRLANVGLVGSWPIHGTGTARMVGRDSNVLATYVVMVCRPIPSDAPLATRREFRSAVHVALTSAVRELQSVAIAPVDLAQAAIGPGMSVFSRYSKVVEADGSAMSVGIALSIINDVLDEILAEQDGEFDAPTRWAIAWFKQYGLNPGPFGVADSLATAKNVGVRRLEEAGLLTSSQGKVKLLAREDLDAGWDPASDRHLTIWEIAQHLVRVLESSGEVSAAAMLRRVGGLGELARDLAYRLFAVCDRGNWTREAQSYNSLVVAWPEIARLAAEGAEPTEVALPRAAGW
jgi:putative DNA methylase